MDRLGSLCWLTCRALARCERRPETVLANPDCDAMLRQLALAILPQKLVHHAAVLARQLVDQRSVRVLLATGHSLWPIGATAAPVALRLRPRRHRDKEKNRCEDT